MHTETDTGQGLKNSRGEIDRENKKREWGEGDAREEELWPCSTLKLRCSYEESGGERETEWGSERRTSRPRLKRPRR